MSISSRLSLIKGEALNSPSSPDIPTQLAPAISLTRSRTLPRNPTSSSIHQGDGETLPELDPLRVVTVRDWICAIAIVDFDIDVGPVVSHVYPPYDLSMAEKENIAFASFPDSTTSGYANFVFSFRIQKLPNSAEKATVSAYIYGYTCFMQSKDPSSRRGYKQRSVTVLSRHAFPELFSEMAERMSLMLWRQGIGVLERACEDVADWPCPGSVPILQLGLLSAEWEVEMPDLHGTSFIPSSPNPNKSFDASPKIQAYLPTLPPSAVSAFGPLLAQMWAIWECVVLCEPIIIYGPSPDNVAAVVWWLRELVKPIPYGGDFRPYFTIQDKDYPVFINSRPPNTGLLLGTTNPLFKKMTRHWPHTIYLDTDVTPQRDSRTNGVHASLSPAPTPSPKIGTGHGEDVPPGWRSRTYKRHTSKDRSLLKKMETLFGAGTALKMEGFSHLRHHFSTRAAEFLSPLNRYFNSLIIPPSSPHIPAHPATRGESEKGKGKHRQRYTRIFEIEAFMASLKRHGTPLPCRSTRQRDEFYRRWIASPSFGLWLASREKEVADALDHSQGKDESRTGVT